MKQVIDKSTVIAEIENKIKEWRLGNSSEAKYRLEVYKELAEWLNAFETKGVDEEPASNDLEEASKKWLRPQLDKSYANYGEVKMMELTHFDGYAMLNAIEFGAQWQKEQIIGAAIKGIARPLDYEVWCDRDEFPQNIQDGDKVKLIIFKEG